MGLWDRFTLSEPADLNILDISSRTSRALTKNDLRNYRAGVACRHRSCCRDTESNEDKLETSTATRSRAKTENREAIALILRAYMERRRGDSAEACESLETSHQKPQGGRSWSCPPSRRHLAVRVDPCTEALFREVFRLLISIAVCSSGWGSGACKNSN